jgi:hypothetical protein
MPCPLLIGADFAKSVRRVGVRADGNWELGFLINHFPFSIFQPPTLPYSIGIASAPLNGTD